MFGAMTGALTRARRPDPSLGDGRCLGKSFALLRVVELAQLASLPPIAENNELNFQRPTTCDLAVGLLIDRDLNTLD
jgi:hypothetical protein